MAVVQFTGLVNQIRGKLNGSVLNKSRTIATMQSKQQPPKGVRGFQSENRQLFSYAQRKWKDLTSVQRIGWGVAASNNPSRNRFGDQVILSGYNQFIKAFMLADYANTPFNFTAYTAPAPVERFSLNVIRDVGFRSSGSKGTSLRFEIDNYELPFSTGYAYIFEVSLPVSAGVTSYHGRWVNVTGSSTDDGIPYLVDSLLGLYYPIPQEGQRVLWRARLIHVQSGAVVVTQDGAFDSFLTTPVIESFSVTPVTGAPPYRLRVVILNKEALDGLGYSFSFGFSEFGNPCPSAAAATLKSPQVEVDLLNTGEAVVYGAVPAARCRTYRVFITRLSDGLVVDQKVVSVSNI